MVSLPHVTRSGCHFRAMIQLIFVSQMIIMIFLFSILESEGHFSCQFLWAIWRVTGGTHYLTSHGYYFVFLASYWCFVFASRNWKWRQESGIQENQKNVAISSGQYSCPLPLPLSSSSYTFCWIGLCVRDLLWDFVCFPTKFSSSCFNSPFFADLMISTSLFLFTSKWLTWSSDLMLSSSLFLSLAPHGQPHSKLLTDLDKAGIEIAFTQSIAEETNTELRQIKVRCCFISIFKSWDYHSCLVCFWRHYSRV